MRTDHWSGVVGLERVSAIARTGDIAAASRARGRRNREGFTD
jgi:hypothetical protein